MNTQASAKREFLRWVIILKDDNLSEVEKKLLNILVDNFDELSLLGTGGGRRAKRLGKLVEQRGTMQSTDLLLVAEEVEASGEMIHRLVEVKIGPFRGFRSQESFIFDKKYTFMYGPNGSGKSSFCEGLEYALLGEIEEAEAKRIPIETYIRNEQTCRGIYPTLTVKTASGEIKTVSQGHAAYRFCFIEKNRIDSFARMSATTARDQLARISSLFGLDHFNEFVNGFTEEFDARYLNLVNQKEIDLNKDKEKIEGSRTRLNQVENDLAAIPEKIAAAIQQIEEKDIATLNQLQEFLSGEDGTSGVIGRLLRLKVESIPDNLDENSVDRVKATHTSMAQDLKSLETQLTELAKLASVVNFKHLYTAIQAVAADSATDKTRCPACQTPIESVAINPFENAWIELQKMEQLTALQKAVEERCQSISTNLCSINKDISLVNTIRKSIGDAALDYELFNQFLFTDISSIDVWKSTLLKDMQGYDSIVTELVGLAQDIRAYNHSLESKRIEQSTVDLELKKYLEIKKCADELEAEWKFLSEEKSKIEREIETFFSQNEAKLQEVEAARKIIDQNIAFKDAYDSLIRKLKRYRDSLPVQLAAGLAGKTCEFFNIINDHDPEFEKLDLLTLPKASGEKIYVKFQGDARLHDALQILSEGHIKTLGLSLLLAKVVADDLGFVIYDDIVNAIDDDHRDGIARLLLESEYLKDRQQIVTCHGELFIAKLAHTLGASAASLMVRNYRFIPIDCVEERGVRVSIGNSSHYLHRAREAFTRNDLKDSLTYCRKVIESVSEQLWKKLGKLLKVNLTVKMRGPKDRPDLASVVDGLNHPITHKSPDGVSY